MAERDSIVTLEYRGRVALLTIDNQAKLNAFTQQQYYDVAQKLGEIATHDEVFITVLTGKGRYFSAGADISTADAGRPASDAAASHRHWLANFVASNLHAARAFYAHPKVLVVGLNGPAVGLSAALVGCADFVYCAPHAFLLVPFSSLGLVAEGAASRALALRLGPARSAEALLMSRRIAAPELVACGFANAVLEAGEGEDDKFRELLLREVDERLGEHLNGESLLGIKKLLRQPEMEVLDRQNVSEVFSGLERFVKGVPQEEFRKLRSGEKRHKL